MGDSSVGLIDWLQESAPWLLPLAEVLTVLGDEDFYVLIFPILYWVISPRVGVRVGAALLVSAGVNAVLKLAFATPRPFWVSDTIDAHVIETSFGLPSGHAQNAVVVWGLLAAELHRRRGWRWIWVPAVALVAGIGVSRWYVGVHAVEDTLAGWVVGAILLIGYVAIEPWLTDRLGAASTRVRLAVAVAVPIGVVLAAVVTRSARGGWESPRLWTENVAAVDPDVDLMPMSIEAALIASGALCGLGLGLIVLHRRVGGFAPHPVSWRRVAALAVGLVVALPLWLGLGMVFPDGDDPVAAVLRFVRYAAVGGWIAGVGPLLFLRAGLAVPAGNAVRHYQSGSPGRSRSGTPSDSSASRMTRKDNPPG